ncbi:ABC transporter permease [Mesorhizobium sanjuanii]|uniref:ABC transporter permease n=1 Tax=Mesorhizobium sanjuanii TaxID=2037900 RepID=A0A2A6FJS1_9HYPH|nr:ABC transporter permease [Mesorhizobium sanjuanii]
MRGPRQLRPGFWRVFLREIDGLRRRLFLLALTTLVPILLMVLLSTIFSAGLATRLPIGVLDLDGSDLSRSIIRAVDATPEAAVTTPVSDLAQGKALIRSGAIHGLLMLPQHLKRDVYAGRRPDVVFFYNTQTLTTGNTILRGVNAAVATVEAGIKVALRTSEGQPVDVAEAELSPVPVQVNALFNPTLSYIAFLLNTVVPAVLQVIIVTSSAYSVGLDVETPHRLRSLRRLGGGLLPAMAGKILPYTLLFLLVLGLSDIVLFGVHGAPLRGNRALLVFAGTLFILACQFLGTLLALVLRPTAKAVSIGSLLTAPAFGFMGIGFPRIAMNGFAFYWGSILPGTWYLMARIDQTVRGTPVDLSLRPVLALAAMVLVFAGLTALVLEVRRIRLRNAAPQPQSAAAA